MAVALAAPQALAAAQILHYPTTASAALVGWALVGLAPLGAARGLLNSAEELLVPAAGTLLVEQMKAQNVDWTALDEGTRGLRSHAESLDITGLLLSEKKGGTLVRGVVGRFMPSTEVLLEHIAAETSLAHSGHDFLSLAKGATNGMIAGHITSVRDKATTAALGLTVLFTCGVIMLDYLAKAATKKE